MPAQVKFTMKKSSAVTIPMSGANGIKKSVGLSTLSIFNKSVIGGATLDCIIWSMVDTH